MNIKHTLSSAVAVAISFAAFADSNVNDKINITSGDQLIRSFKISDINDISYEDFTAGGFKKIRFDVAGREPNSILIDDIQKMEYVEGLPENPWSVTVAPHHMSATLTVENGNENCWYRIAGKTFRELKDIDSSIWADYLVQDDIAYLLSVADYYEKPLSSWPMSDLAWNTPDRIDWFPAQEIEAGQDIALCLYTFSVDGNDVEVTTEPILLTFKCKDIEDVGTRFDISTDLTSTKVTVKVDPIDDPEIQYYFELYSAYDVLNNGLQYCVANTLLNIERMIYQYGVYSSWDDVLFTGHAERTWKNLCSGEVYVAVAFGVEQGVTTTAASIEEIVVPLATPTDPCTFEVVQTQLNPSEVQLAITPSNTDTRYVTMLVKSEKIAGDPDEYKAEYWASTKVQYLNTLHSIDWSASPLVMSGAQTITTNDNMVDKALLQVGTEYTVLIFGVDGDGTRTTELLKIPVVTTEETPEEPLTFEITFDNFDTTSPYFRFVHITAVPSDPEMTYVFDKLKVSNSYANIDDYTDGQFIQRYTGSMGQYLNTRTGTLDYELSMNMDATWTDYCFFIFGYNGGQTGPLYYYRINPETGEITRLRGAATE